MNSDNRTTATLKTCKKGHQFYKSSDCPTWTEQIVNHKTSNCNGEVTNPKIIRGLSPSDDRVAIDLVRSMPNWIPGEQGGRKVKVIKTYQVIVE